MTEQIIEILKRNETLSGNNEFVFIPRYKYATMANEIIEAIEVMRCCTELKGKEAPAFEEWLSHFKKEDDCYWLNKETLYCKEVMKLHYDELPDE